MKKEITELMLDEVESGMSEINGRLLALRNMHCTDDVTGRAKVALDSARNRAAAAMHYLRQARTLLVPSRA